MKKEEILEKMEALVKEGETRSLTEEENAQFAELESKLAAVKEQEARRAKLDAEKRELEKVNVEERPLIQVGKDRDENLINSEIHRRAFIKSIIPVPGFQLTDMEKRALEAGVASEGGNVVPTEFIKQIENRILNINRFRQLGARVMTTSSLSKLPVVVNKPTAAFVAEEGTYGTSDPSFGQLSLDAHKLGLIVQASDELISDSFIDLENHIVNEVSEAFAVKEEDAIVSGAGTTEPLGLLNTTSVAGRAVVNYDITGSSTAVTADDLMEMLYGQLKPQMLSRPGNKLTWIISQSTYAAIRKLKDSNGRYILESDSYGLANGGSVPSILGKPVIVSDHMNDMAEDTISFLLVDLNYLVIGDRKAFEVMPLRELYAATGQVGWRFTKRFDSLLVNADAMITGTNNAV